MVDQIAKESPELYHMYGRTLNKLEELRMREVFRTFMTECTWLWGATGTGKSERDFEGYGPSQRLVPINALPNIFFLRLMSVSGPVCLLFMIR